MQHRMIRVNRAGARIGVQVGALLLAVPALMPTALHAAVPAPALCSIAPFSLDSLDSCYPPSKITVAERQMKIHPVRPTGIVARATGLALTHLLVSKRAGTTTIDYLAGTIPRAETGTLDYAGSSRLYVLVSESTVPGPYRTGRLMKIVNPAGPKQLRDEVYWEYDASFRCHKLSLTVTSNEASAVVQRVGERIRALETCGKV